MTLLPFSLGKATADNVRLHNDRCARSSHIHVHKDCINVWWGADRGPTTYHPADFCLLRLVPRTKNIVLRPYYRIDGNIQATSQRNDWEHWAGPEFTIEIEVPE